MTRDYIRNHVVIVAKVFGVKPFPGPIIDLITDKLMAHPGLQEPNGHPGSEFCLGQRSRHYVEEINKLTKKEKPRNV